MKLENQVVSLELAKKLKNLGVEQKGAFYWKASNNTLKYNDGSLVEIDTELLFGKTPIFKTLGTWEPYTAFTVAELGEMLPKTVVDEKGKRHPKEYRGVNAYGQHIVSYHENFEPPLETVFADTEADARAKMLIFLLEHDLIVE